MLYEPGPLEYLDPAIIPTPAGNEHTFEQILGRGAVAGSDHEAALGAVKSELVDVGPNDIEQDYQNTVAPAIGEVTHQLGNMAPLDPAPILIDALENAHEADEFFAGNPIAPPPISVTPADPSDGFEPGDGYIPPTPTPTPTPEPEPEPEPTPEPEPEPEPVPITPPGIPYEFSQRINDAYWSYLGHGATNEEIRNWFDGRYGFGKGAGDIDRFIAAIYNSEEARRRRGEI